MNIAYLDTDFEIASSDERCRRLEIVGSECYIKSTRDNEVEIGLIKLIDVYYMEDVYMLGGYDLCKTF